MGEDARGVDWASVSRSRSLNTVAGSMTGQRGLFRHTIEMGAFFIHRRKET